MSYGNQCIIIESACARGYIRKIDVKFFILK